MKMPEIETGEEDQQMNQAATAQNTESAPAADTFSDEDFLHELREARWSLVSFEKCIASNLTYDEAASLLKEFAEKGTSGLCVITDEAAARI